MRSFLISLFCFFIFFNGYAQSQVITGNDLISACNGLSGEQQGFCLAYVIGVTEGIRFGAGYSVYASGVKEAKDVNSFSDHLLRYCIDENVTSAQNVDVVRKYLLENPHERHFPARLLVLQAYQRYYPCRTQWQ